MTFTLPDLPYAKDALEPHMSEDTLTLHHDKHHQKYVDNANKLTEGTDIADMNLEAAVVAAHQKGGGVFNNIGQHYNHCLFWQCMSPNGGGKPSGALAEKIDEDFGSFDDFVKKFTETGAGQFGSGWVWLVVDKSGKLDVINSANAENPVPEGKTPILNCDVWEHSYYLDFQNRRPDYLKSFLDNLVNWDFVAEQFDKATS